MVGTASGLTLTSAVALLTLYRNAHTDDGLTLTPRPTHRPLAPTQDSHVEILSRLLDDNLIAVDPNSPADAFEFAEDNSIKAFYWLRVHWRLLPGATAEQAAEVLALIEANAREGTWLWSDDDVLEALGQWEELALAECLQFFDYQGNAHHLPNPSGDKTKLMFASLLKDFAVSQIYSFIWSAAQNAAAYYQRGGVSKSQAGNSMVGSCRGRADRARISGWEVKGFHRNHDLPRSELSHVLLDTFLAIGEAGFIARPSLQALPQAKLTAIAASENRSSEIPF